MKAIVFPGQGSQYRGMGRELFSEFPEQVTQADRILGYSIAELCVNDPDGALGNTKYAQPAIYVVNALSYLKVQGLDHEQVPDLVAGHSLGEYSALFAAGAFDFETGLKIVQKRAALMSEVKNGGMAAVIGADVPALQKLIETSGCSGLEIANRNTRLQNVLSGPKAELATIEPSISAANLTYVPLSVSGAFHSAAMSDARQAFSEFLRHIEFNWLRIPVVSNVEALPYSQARIKSLLSSQITSPVRWFDSIAYMRRSGVSSIEELGPGNVLTKMIAKIDADLS